MCSLIRSWATEHTHNVMALSSRCVQSSITWIHFKLSRREGKTNHCFLSRWSDVLRMFQTSPAYTLALPAGLVLIISFIKCDQKKKIILLLSSSLSKHISPYSPVSAQKHNIHLLLSLKPTNHRPWTLALNLRVFVWVGVGVWV